jgi:hypothetical protein
VFVKGGIFQEDLKTPWPDVEMGLEVENAKALQASSGVCEMSPEVKVLSPV